MKYTILIIAIYSLFTACHKKPVQNTGTAIFYTNTASYGVIDVSIDGSPVGSITQFYQGTPNCNSAGCITLTLNKGTHSINAHSNTKDWDGTINVISDTCNEMYFN